MRGEASKVRQRVGGDGAGAVNGGTQRTGVGCGKRENAMGHEAGEMGPS